MVLRASTEDGAPGAVRVEDHFRPARPVRYNMTENRYLGNTARDIIKENLDSLSYMDQEPGPFPRSFPRREDQPRLHTTVRCKDNNLAICDVCAGYAVRFPWLGKARCPK